MLQQSTSPLKNGPLNNTLHSYRSSSEPTFTQPYKFESSPSTYSLSQPIEKLENLHPHPSLNYIKDGIYQTRKRVKLHGKDHNMLRDDKENGFSGDSSVEQNTCPQSPRKLELDLSNSKVQNMSPYENTELYSNSNLQMPANQPVDQQLLLQNIYYNTLVETEMLRRYNELQELAFLQNTNNGMLPGNFTNMFLLSLYEKQKQDYYNFYLLKEAQQQLEAAQFHRNPYYLNSQIREADNSLKQNNKEVIMISDDDEKDQMNTASRIDTIDKNLRENVMIKSETTEAQNNNILKSEDKYTKYVQEEDVSSFKDSYTSDFGSIKEGKITKVTDEFVTGSNSSRRQRAANKWQIAKEYEEHLKAEAEKPYVIDIHIDPNSNQKINKTSVGPAYQTVIPPFKLNHGRKAPRVVKPIWKPDIMGKGKLEEAFAIMEGALGEKIMNQEKAVKLIVRFGMNIEAVRNEIEKNDTFYRNYFKTNPRVLRKRQAVV